MTDDWLKRKDEFLTIDRRGVTADMLPAILFSARKAKVGGGLHVIQEFEPKELYGPLEELGFEYKLIRVSDNEYQVYFHRLGIP